MLKILGAVLLALVAVCNATNRNGILYPFPIGSTLVCHLSNPFSDVPGEPLSIPEQPPRIPLAPTLVNDGFIRGVGGESLTYQLWLPQESGFRMPSTRGLDYDELLAFLGSDFNRQLTSVSFPQGRDPPRACDLLPAFEGSAGQRLIHPELVQERVPLFEDFFTTPGGSERANSLIFNQTIADPDFSDRVPASSNFERSDFGQAEMILQQTNGIDQLWDFWIARCPLAPKWVKLPHSFFPRYLAQSVCSGKNCSIPRGLTCQEDFTYTVHVTVLRWDCCYNHLNRETLWECGWRKVQIPIFCDCTCSCSEVSAA